MTDMGLPLARVRRLGAWAATQACDGLKGGAQVIVEEMRWLLKPDWISSFIVIALLVLFLPTIGRHADDGLMLATFFDDDALITMQLDGMTVWPYGNPATYLGMGGVPKQLPSHWKNFNYQNLPYYGGFFLDLAWLIWVPLKLFGLPLFPTAPIILRGLAILFTMCTILAAYNFGRRYFGLIAALSGALFLATEHYFIFIGTVAHPDSLLFFITIVALAICGRHARDGDMASLFAVGMVAGLAQGAKLGGPLLVPITVIAIGWGARQFLSEGGWFQWTQHCVRRGALTMVIALIVFIVTTPYAILDSYFFYTWQLWAKSFAGTSPISITTFWDWARHSRTHIADTILILGVMGALVLIAKARDPKRTVPYALTLVLGLTIFFWYATLQKFWVQLQYLIIPFWILAMLSGYCLDQALFAFPALRRKPYRTIVTIGAAILVTAFSLTRASSTTKLATEYVVKRNAPNYVIDGWASKHLAIERGGKILIDGPTYFNPEMFPNIRWNGGPIRYGDLLREMPEYFTLTRYAYKNWQNDKISGPKLDHWNKEYANVRLYQELLGTDPQMILLDARSTPFVDFVASFGWMGSTPTEETSSSEITLQHMLLKIPRLADVVARAVTSTGSSSHIALFKLDREKFAERVPAEYRHLLGRPIASSSMPDSPPASILLAGGQTWRSTKRGQSAVGEYIGFEFPHNRFVAKEVVITWVDWTWCPGTIEIEYSADGATWQSAGIFPVAKTTLATVKNQSGRWDETFNLPDTGPHRFWRVTARSVPNTHFFGVEKIRIN